MATAGGVSRSRWHQREDDDEQVAEIPAERAEDDNDVGDVRQPSPEQVGASEGGHAQLSRASAEADAHAIFADKPEAADGGARRSLTRRKPSFTRRKPTLLPRTASFGGFALKDRRRGPPEEVEAPWERRRQRRMSIAGGGSELTRAGAGVEVDVAAMQQLARERAEARGVRIF